MLYGKFIDELIDRLKLNKAKSEDRVIAGRKICGAYKEIANVATVNWEPLKRIGEVVTVSNYTTGTATITNGSRSVTFGGGAALTSAMEGRFFQPQGTSNWYRIVKVNSATDLTLYTPIIESSATGTYTIWKRYYYLPSEVRKIIDFGSWIRDGALMDRSNQAFQDKALNLSSTGDPIEFSMFGVDPFESSYTTGTISLTKDSDLATGASTAWLDNVTPGDILIVGTTTYRVKRVESDTSIRLLNFANATITSQTYTIRRESNLGFQLWYNPNQATVLPYYYVKRAYDLVNEDYDKPELPEEFDKAILDGAEADRLGDLNDPKAITKLQLYNARINDLKTTRYVSQPRTVQLKPRIVSRGSYL